MKAAFSRTYSIPQKLQEPPEVRDAGPVLAFLETHWLLFVSLELIRRWLLWGVCVGRNGGRVGEGGRGKRRDFSLTALRPAFF